MITVAIAAVGFGGAMLLFQRGYAVLAVALAAATITALLLAILIASALSGIYAAAVYYFSVVGKTPVDFDGDLIRDAFTRKGA
jgi:predicted secreted Zn-dependent protease